MSLTNTLDLKNTIAFKKIFGTEKHATPLMPGLDDRMGAKGEEKLKAVQWLDVVPLPNSIEKACSVLDTFNGTAVALNDDRDNNALKTHHVTGVS